MRTVTTPPITTQTANVGGRYLGVSVHHEPTRPLPWVATVTYSSEWEGEAPLCWEVSAGTPSVLIDVLRLFDLRPKMVGIRVRPGDVAPPAMEARREQLRMVWEGLVGRVKNGLPWREPKEMR